MEYISVKEAARIWGIDTSRIGKLARNGRIEGAKIVGRNWLIPGNAPRPIDGRTRMAKESKEQPSFRFPLYINFPETSFFPPLSKEETSLRQAQIDFYACEYRKAAAVFQELAENAESIYVKICALFFMCVLSAVYDIHISWEKYYCGMNLLLAADFPHKKEMELFLPWLDFIIGQFGSVPEKLNTDSTFEYHPTAWYMNAFLSVISFQGLDENLINVKCSEPFATLCRLMERDGCYVEAQELHMILFQYHFGTHNEDAMQYHLRKAIKLAYEQDLLFTVADAEAYYAEAFNAVLCEYPDSFAERIRKNSKIIYANFSRFARRTSKTTVFERLSKSDFRYAFYAVKGFTNKQIAGFCGVSERTVAKKYNDIYEKMGINSKQRLVAEVGAAFGKKGQ